MRQGELFTNTKGDPVTKGVDICRVTRREAGVVRWWTVTQGPGEFNGSKSHWDMERPGEEHRSGVPTYQGRWLGIPGVLFRLWGVVDCT